MIAALAGTKRSREDLGNEAERLDGPLEKKSRAGTVRGDSDTWFPHDSVLSTPTASFRAREQLKYDSDDEHSSSMVSDPGSPQDISMSSGDEGAKQAAFSQSPKHHLTTQPRPAAQSPWGTRLRTERLPTPAVPMLPGVQSPRVRTGVKQHIRSRHPQQNSSGSDHLELSPLIDGDELPTPPSAAEAAGSQLSQLSVSDIDMAEAASVPATSLSPSSRTGANVRMKHSDVDLAVNRDLMEHGADSLLVRKQRARSGALSAGDSPVRAGPTANVTRRGFSMGFRADCERCQRREPGHMNHFTS